MTKRQLIFFRVLFVLYIALVLYLCFGNFSDIKHIPRSYFNIPTDKIVHFLMFLPFPVLAYLAFDRFTDKFWSSAAYTALTFLVGCLLAAGTEIGQARLTRHRSGDFLDFRADLFALALSTLVVFILDIRKQRRNEKNP